MRTRTRRHGVLADPQSTPTAAVRGAAARYRPENGRDARPPGAPGGSHRALDPRAADDRLAPVCEADERLALAVVVGRPDDERRLLAGDRAGLVEPRRRRRARSATNGFSSHSRPIVVSSVWPGSTRVSSAAPSARPSPSRGRRRRRPAADRVLEERVAREAEPVDDEGDVVVGVAGRRKRLDAQAADLRSAATPKRRSSSVVAARRGRRGRASVSRCVTVRPSRSTTASSGSSGAPLSTKNGRRRPARPATR